MSDDTLSTTVDLPYDAAVVAVKEGLGQQGFGVLTEIDLAAALEQKIGADLPPQVILGACRPQLAHVAIQADPSVAAMLPCNVVVRAVDGTTSVVEAFDPAAMVAMGGKAADPEQTSPLTDVADDARARLTAMLDALG
ncbi:DUF302 domain-containing protein [Nocardioides sp. CFH 31398]|uniref:DUF302 domain-containing protein n=1 Tax=Nocardioides sp. CFH 31398 TaxID=2919579 RepID=UPI001F070612|nr:DUF302 domain-containing protein [Nocardioides sp. CFH 31398]MCH1865520.1 DUF302 domain-containing protein [Nocardioides sp. CFH 31398]